MKFSLHLPAGHITPGQFQTMEAISQMAKALEDAGVDACFLTEHPAPMADWLHANGHDAVDPFTALAFVAAASTTLKLHTNIVVLPYRNPFLTAKAAATLQVLSGGRLLLGVGVGYQKGEFDALGVDFHKRGALADEALEVLRMAWGGGAVVKQGMGWNAVGNEPRPAPDPQPTVWIGGGSDKAMERAVRWGDGWSPFFDAPTLSANNRGISSVAVLAEKIKQVKEMRSAAGKTSPFDFVIGARTFAKNRSPQEAEQLRQEVGELAEAGIDWTFVYLGDESRPEFLENVQWFGEEVVGR